MHYDGIRTVNDPIVLSQSPPCILIVLGILEVFQKATFGPNVLANSAAYHTKEVPPIRRLSVWTETPIVVTCVYRPAIGPWDLTAKRRRCLRILQGIRNGPKPIRTLWSSVRVEKYSEVRACQPHAVVHHAPWAIFMRLNLNE